MFIAGMSSITEPPLNDLWTIEGEKDLLDKFRAEDEAFFKTINATVYFFSLKLEDFCGAVMDGRPPASNGEEGRETVKFIETLLKAGVPRGRACQ
jgi:hypothetical protein